MAEIAFEQRAQIVEGAVSLFRWPRTGLTLAGGDTGAWLRLPGRNDKTVQVMGTLPGDVTIEGTLEDETPTSPSPLNDSRGETFPLIFTGPDIRTVMEGVTQIRPTVAGVGGSVIVLLRCERPG